MDQQCDVLKIKKNKKRKQNPWRLRSRYKWMKGVVVIKQRIDKYKKTKKREI